MLGHAPMSAGPVSWSPALNVSISTLSQGPARPSVPLSGPDAAHRRQIAEALNRVVNGQIACTFMATLQVNAFTTTFQDPRIGPQTHASFSPTTADAAAELASGAMYWTCTTGQMVVRHRNAATTDRIFTVSLLG